MQGGDRASQQETSATLAGQHMRLHDLDLVGNTIVGGIVGIDQVLVGIGTSAVTEQPALGRRGWCIGFGVIDYETGHQLLACASVGVVIDRAGVFNQTRLFQHQGFLLR